MIEKKRIDLILIIFLIRMLTFGCTYHMCESQKELCKEGPIKTHITCDPDSVEKTGTFVAPLPMTFKVMRLLQKEINTRRNKVASGTETLAGNERFYKAGAMREVIWDTELEFVAHRRAIRCSVSPKDCHATTTYRHAGELNGVHGSSSMIGVEESFDAIFNRIYEQKNAIPNRYDVGNYSEKLQALAPDFTLLISEEVSKVGCAVAYCRNCKDSADATQNHCFYLTCLFDFMNMINCEVYGLAQSVPADKCGIFRSKRSPTYENLCVNDGRRYESKCLAHLESLKAPPPTPPQQPGAKPPGPTPAPTAAPAPGQPPAPTAAPAPGTAPPSGPTTVPPSGRPPPTDATAKIPPFPHDKYGYCKNEEIKNKLCSNKVPHIVCYPETIPLNGTLWNVFEMGEYERNMCTDLHDQLRDEIASGQAVNAEINIKYPPATRMVQLTYSLELEYISEVHARRCYFEHSHCQNTLNYRYIGQNLAVTNMLTKPKKPSLNFDKGAKHNIKGWYFEKDCIDDPTIFPSSQKLEYGPAGAPHFTIFINDQITVIGCASTHCKNTWDEFGDHYSESVFLACHYNAANIVYSGMYRPGPSTSECDHWKVGKSTKYKHLCAQTTEVFPYELWGPDWGETVLRPQIIG